MKDFEKISKMNLADLDRPNVAEDDYEEEMEEPSAETTDEDHPPKEEKDVVTVADVEGTDEAEDILQGAKGVEKEHMRDPEGKNYYVDAKIGEKEMIAFLFGHNYRQPIMIIAMIVAIIWPVMTIVRQDGSLWYAIVVIVVVFAILPYSTWSRGRRTIRNNPGYEDTFHYMLDEWGLHLELGDSAVDQEWSKINKCMFLKSVTVLYTGKANAFLIPTAAMGERTAEINAFIKANRTKK